MTAHGCVTLDRDGAIARVALNRPAQMNAINPALLEDLWTACDEVERDPSVKVVTLTGTGRAFSGGADLRAVRELSPDPDRWASFMGLWHRVFNRIEALPQPVIAGVHGLALAGGLELVLVCDLAVADEEARLGDQHANFGLVAGGGGTRGLADGARGAGVGPRQPRGAGWAAAGGARRMALKLADLSGGASRTAKALVNRAADVDLASGLDLEVALVAQHMRSADAAEGLRAFGEKQRPAFA